MPSEFSFRCIDRPVTDYWQLRMFWVSVDNCVEGKDQTDDIVVDCPLCVSFRMVSTLNRVPPQIQCFVSLFCSSFARPPSDLTKILAHRGASSRVQLFESLGIHVCASHDPYMICSLLSDMLIATPSNDGPTELSAETFLASILVALVARWLAAWSKTVSVECFDSFLMTLKTPCHMHVPLTL